MEEEAARRKKINSYKDTEQEKEKDGEKNVCMYVKCL